jgi:[ribosomal protein S5]-alanine N-acetyltransferase
MGFLEGLLTQKPDITCKGARVILRSPRVDDLEQWRSLRKASRSFLEPWEPQWQDDEFLLSSYRRRINHYSKLVAEDLAYPFFIFMADGATMLGGITLSNVRRGVAQMATLGYWIAEPHARQGHMTDALTVITGFAADELGLHRLEASCLPTNTASMRLLERAGFTREGFAKAYLRIAGQWEDHVLWGKVLV